MENTQTTELLDFQQEKVQVLTLEQLRRTHKENDIMGQPLKGIYHCDLIGSVSDILSEAGLRMQVDEIFAAQNKDRLQPGVVLLPQVEAQYGKNAIEAHVLRRVYANISVHDLDDEEFTTNLAVAFHQNGIQIGFGNMVRVCHNQTILGAKRIVSTYGDDRKTVNGLLETVREWSENIRDIILPERERLKRMQQREMQQQETLQMIGSLTAIRVSHDTSKAEIRRSGTYPMGQSQINQFTESLMLTRHRNGKVTLWDVYNAATDLFKADKMEIPNILPQHAAMTEFLAEYELKQ